MPTKMRKPVPWPPRELEWGKGSWIWEPKRTVALGIKFSLGGKRVKAWGHSVPEAIAERDRMIDTAKREALEKADRQARLANGERTVAELLAEWVVSAKKGRAPQTCQTYERTIAKVARTDLPAVVVSRAVRGDIRRCLESIVDNQDQGQSSMEQIRHHLGMAFDHGMDDGYCATNPVRGIKLPGNVRKKGRAQWLKHDQFPAMRRYLLERNDMIHTALLTGLLTGLRPGEVLGLCWDAVDLKEGTAAVIRQIQRSEGNRVRTLVPALKTEQSVRVVQLPTDLVLALKAEQQRRRERQLRAGQQWKPNNLVFTSLTGGIVRFEYLNERCRSACERLGIPPLSPNKLRHSNATALLAAGLTVPDLAMHMGHKDNRMVMTTYGHSDKDVVPTAELLGG
jgi:integrase